jgi:hypothetical protein
MFYLDFLLFLYFVFSLNRYYSPGYADELLERVENHSNKA